MPPYATEEALPPPQKPASDQVDVPETAHQISTGMNAQYPFVGISLVLFHLHIVGLRK